MRGVRAFWCVAALALLDGQVGAAPLRGSTEGTFFASDVPCVPPIVCTGIGTSRVTWGAAQTTLGPSSVQFTGLAFDVDVLTPFAVGLVRFENRPVDTGSYPGSFDLAIRANITSIPTTSNLTVRMFQESTVNTADPDASADRIWFVPDIYEQRFAVYEDQFEVATVMAEFYTGPVIGPTLLLADDTTTYQLRFLGLGESLGPGGFLDPAVPEPSTGALLLAAFAAFTARRALRKH
jgi:hypothetical protein